MNSLPPSADNSAVTKDSSSDRLKLAILRHEDTARRWATLDDLRVCVLCGNEFRGRDIEVTQEHGSISCKCPTRDCRGGVRHFVLPGNPLLEVSCWSDWMAAFGEEDEESAESNSAG